MSFPDLLVDVSMKSTLLLFAVWVVTRFWVQRPAVRVLFWDVALVGSFCLAISAFGLPKLTMPILTPEPIVAESVVKTSAFEIAPVPDLVVSEPVVSGDSEMVLASAFNWSSFIWIVYFLGASVGIFRLVLGSVKISHLRQSIVLANGDQLDRLRYWRDRLNIQRSVDLGFSDAVCVPTLIGILHPVIVVPTNTNPKDQDAILVHELSHLTRWDPVRNLLSRLVIVMYWFHPGFYLAQTLAAQAREEACDDWAVSALGNARQYATTLLNVTEQMGQRLALSLDMARSNDILDRTARIIALGQKITPKVGRVMTGFIVTSVFTAAILLGSLQPTYSEVKEVALDPIPAQPAIVQAAFKGYSNGVKKAMESGESINTQDPDSGLTALIAAASRNHGYMVSELISYGANVDMVLKDGRSALMVAAQKGFRDIVHRLYGKAGANIHIQLADGRTALMLAAQNGHHSVVSDLIQFNADISLKTSDGKTARDLAAENGHIQSARYLAQQEAQGRNASTFFVQFDEIVVNPAESDGKRFLGVDVGLKLSSMNVQLQVEAGMGRAIVKDVLVQVFSSKTLEELHARNIKKIKAEIMALLNEQLGENAVLAVYFPKFVIQ